MQTENGQEGQMSFFDQDIWFGKMSRECFPQMTERTSDVSSKRLRESATVVPQFLDCRQESLGLMLGPFWQTDGLWLGRYMTHSFSAWHKDAEECRLSQILEDNPHSKYYLSEKACQGILRRAERRGKELPKVLRDALLRQASLSKFGGGAEYDSHGKQAGKGALIQEELSGTLGVSQDQTLFCFGISPYESNAMKSDNPYSGIYEAETSRTLDIHGANPDCQQGGVLVLESSLAHARVETTGLVPTLPSRSGTGGNNCPMVLESRVRRLTPLECERLQGFPDGWTDIGEWTDTKGKKHKASDAPRYKALGNSIAVGYANNKKGFWCWLADRMVKALREQGTEHPTMASLFDGIGGFPLAFSAYGCTPVWASEIEEFPIAVTKKHFPDKED